MQYRNTRQRKIVLEAVQEHHDHPSADQIYLEIRTKDPRISRGTVYRNLNILSGEGQITHVKVPGADRYDCRTDFHYHLICMGCGAVCDAPFSYDPTLDKTLAAESGYRITRHRLIFEVSARRVRRLSVRNKRCTETWNVQDLSGIRSNPARFC